MTGAGSMLLALAGSLLKRAWRIAALGTALAASAPGSADAQIKARLAAGITPPWNKGIQPISRDNYWNAVECGKQGGERPACVFYDADLCKNEDFVLALFTPYKLVAFETWQATRKRQEPLASSYGDAQKTRITLGVTPVKGSKNTITGVSIKRGGGVVKPATQALEPPGGRFIFDFAAFWPTTDITIELVGSRNTHTCFIAKPVLALFR
jgi:hypothetical protein